MEIIYYTALYRVAQTARFFTRFLYSEKPREKSSRLAVGLAFRNASCKIHTVKF